MRIHHRPALPGFERETLAGAPETDTAMAMVIAAWRDLEGERPLGYGVVGFIPYRAVLAWSSFNRLDRELTEMLVTVLQRLDADRADRDAAARALKSGGRG